MREKRNRPGWGLTPTLTASVGLPRRRTEDARLVTGRGRFIDDFSLPSMLHMAVVRSPVAHARLGGVDASQAQAAPGVVMVATAADLPVSMATLSFNHPPRAQVVEAGHTVLARDKVRYVGEPVAVVLATSPQAAVDAVQLVQLDLEPLPAVVEAREDSGGPSVHEAAPDNVLMRWEVSGGDLDQAFAKAAVVVSQRYVMPRMAAAPMEPRGSVSAYDEASGVLTVWCSSQDQHRPRTQLSQALALPLERLRVVVPDVGGAFGAKGPVPVETVVASFLAIKTGQPVKWVEDRQANLLGTYQGRGVVSEAQLALTAEGRMVGLRARLEVDFGAFMILNTATVPLTTAALLCGPYTIGAASVEVLGLATNKVPSGPYRGAGRPEAGIILEGLVERAARALEIDPAELRRRNFIPADGFPYRSPVGMVYDSGNYQSVFARALELSRYDVWRTRQGDGPHPARRLGVGVSASVERSGTGFWDEATVSVDPDGLVKVVSMSTATGQGHQTTFAQIAGDALGLPAELIRVEQGDSGFGPIGVGTFGSRATSVGGSAVLQASLEVKATLDRLAAHLLDARQVNWDGPEAFDPLHPERRIGLPAIAEAAHNPSLPEGLAGGLSSTARFTLTDFVVSFGAYVAVVEIDLETGLVEVLNLTAVDDAGNIVNPLLAEGQVVGGAVQGMAEALLEEVIHDPDGQPLTQSFLDYQLPTVNEVPEMECEFMATPSPLNPLGAKGIGEAGSIGAPAAIASAICDALREHDWSSIAFPFTLERTWRIARG